MKRFSVFLFIILAPISAIYLYNLISFDDGSSLESVSAFHDAQRRAAESEFRSLFGKRCVQEPSVLKTHGKDPGSLEITPPFLVVFPETNEEVQQIVLLCRKFGLSIIPYGAGTSLERNIVPLESPPARESVSVDLSKMNSVLELNTVDLFVRVQAGIRRHALNAELKKDGVFFPIDPGSDASLGGMVGTGASGPYAVRYGTMRSVVMMLKVVTASGKIIDTGSYAPKSSSGYDLTHLMIGSEGTLGIVTEVVVRLSRLPEQRAGGIARFDRVEDAAAAVQGLRLDHVPLAKIEFLNSYAIRAVNKYFEESYPEVYTLFLEFHSKKEEKGDEGVVFKDGDFGERSNRQSAFDIELEKMERLFRDEFHCSDFKVSSDEKAMDKLWHIRANAYYANMKLRGNKLTVTDTCVPISNFSSSIVATEIDFRENSFLPYPIVGHVGDGNFHLMIPFDRNNETERAEITRMYDRLLVRTLELRGTVTGEHGIGRGKRTFLVREHGENAVEMMRSIKFALDPEGLLNPGKVLLD